MNYVCSCGEKYLSDQGRIDCEKSHARRTTSQIAAVFKHEAEQLQGLLEIANAGTASHIATIKALEYKLEAALDERRAQAAVIKDLEASNTDLIIEVNEAKGRLDKLTSEQAVLEECERLEARLDAANAVADAQARRLTEQLEADYAQRIAAESRLDSAVGLLRCLTESFDENLTRKAAEFVAANTPRVDLESVRGILAEEPDPLTRCPSCTPEDEFHTIECAWASLKRDAAGTIIDERVEIPVVEKRLLKSG